MAKFFLFPFAQAGDKAAIPDDTQPSGSVSYETGFTADYQKDLLTDPDAKPIPRDQSNQLYFDITEAIRQYQTNGAPDWITAADNGGVAFPYEIYSVVRYDDGILGMQLFMSLTAANVVTPATAGVVAPSWRLVSASPVPIGTAIDFCGTALQPGFLACDGTAVSRTTYALLFAAIGTTWGVGDGSTTFNLPDFRRKTSIGSGGTGSAVIGNAVGNTGGNEGTVIVQANLPSAPLTGELNIVMGNATAGATSEGNSAGGTPNTATFRLGGSDTPLNIIQPSNVVYKQIKYA
jgi:microcystin-dependent protein